MSELLDTPVTRLAPMVRSGEVGPLELVDANIARIRAVEPLINALTADRFEAARSEAIAAGEEGARARARGEADALPALHGIPCTIKEFHVRHPDEKPHRRGPCAGGIRSSSGSWTRGPCAQDFKP